MTRSAFVIEELRTNEPANEVERAHRAAMLDLIVESNDLAWVDFGGVRMVPIGVFP